MTTMDFFARQREAQRATRWLVFGFGIAVLCILGLIYGVVTWAIVNSDPGQSLFQPQVLAWTVLLAGGTIGVASFVRTAMLRSGGGARVAELLGGKELPQTGLSAGEQQLRNVVEEMAIASGVPMPRVFVLDEENHINAFAAGWGTKDAAVAVTRGVLEHLSRDELQGVVAHEFSHVFHGDMRLNMRLMGLIFGIVCIATAGRILMRIGGEVARMNRGGGKKGSNPAIAFFMGGLALIVIGSIGVMFARILQAAISRQREFLADAAAVQYTRNPRGIAMALARISEMGSGLGSPRTPESRHMLFAEGTRGFFANLCASHPPMLERIDRVLPGFRTRVRSTRFTQAVEATPSPAGADSGAVGSVSGLAAPLDTPSSAERLLARTGGSGPVQVEAARDWIGALSSTLFEAAHAPASARCLVLALLLARDPAHRSAQLQQLGAQGEPMARIAELASATDGIGPGARLPLLELALPALRDAPGEDRASLLTHASALATHDGELSVFEFVLLQLVAQHAHAKPTPAVPPRQRPLRTVLAQAQLCLGAIAWHGTADEGAAQEAFARGAEALGADLMLPARTAATVDALTAALADLDRLGSTDKRRMLLACGRTAAADGVLGTEEVELVRGLAARWDCPIPPMLQG